MKAVFFEEPGKPALVKETPIPKPAKGEVLVKIHAASLNRRDLWIKEGIYQGSIFPCIVGSDGAGIIEQVGDGVEDTHIGRKVVINPALNWGENPNHHGKDFSILGLPAQGTLAEYVSVPLRNIHTMPSWLSFEQAAAIPLAGLTAYRALFTRGGVQEGENVFITGIGGGVAMYLLKFAVAKNTHVYISSGTEKKIKKAVHLGALSGVLYNEPNWDKKILEQSQLEGFDLIIDSAAGKNFPLLLSILNVGGRIVNFGGTAGKIPEFTAAKLFWKQASIIGTTMGSPNDFEAMINFMEDRKIQPEIDKIFPMEDTELAFKHMKNQEQFGKIVIKTG